MQRPPRDLLAGWMSLAWPDSTALACAACGSQSNRRSPRPSQQLLTSGEYDPPSWKHNRKLSTISPNSSTDAQAKPAYMSVSQPKGQILVTKTSSNVTVPLLDVLVTNLVTNVSVTVTSFDVLVTNLYSLTPITKVGKKKNIKFL